MKKVLLIIVVIFIFTIFLMKINRDEKNSKFYLEDKYYKVGELISIDMEELMQLENSKESFILFVHIPGTCSMKIPFDPIIEEFSGKEQITIYSINYLELSRDITKYVEYSPSVVLYSNGKIQTFLDPNNKEDLDYYSSLKNFKKWVSSYIELNS